MMHLPRTSLYRMTSGAERSLYWFCVGTVGVLIVFYGTSFVLFLEWCWAPLHGLRVYDGTLAIVRPQPPPYFLSADDGFWVAHFECSLQYRVLSCDLRSVVLPTRNDSLNVTITTIPLWIPISALVFILWLVRPRQAQAVHNRCSCGYSLFGNISGICPECGQSIGPRDRNRTRLRGQSRRPLGRLGV